MAWSEHFGFRNWCEAANSYPVYAYVEPTRKKRNIFWIDGNEFTTTGQDWTVRDLYLDAFKNPDCSEARIKLANCNEPGCEYTVTLGKYDKDDSKRWLNGKIIKDEEGLGDKTACIDTILLTIDREKLAKEDDKTDVVIISGNDGHGAKILVKVHVDANVPCHAELVSASGDETPKQVRGDSEKNIFVQTTNYISIEAPHFVRSSGFNLLPGYGKTLGAVKAAATTQTFAPGDEKAPFVEYAFALDKDFVEKTEGLMAFDFYINPSNPAYKDNKLQFVAEVNGEKILKDAVDPEKFAVGDNQFPWGEDIPNNIRIATVYAGCHAGLNSVKLRPVTPKIVLEKIVIHEANKTMPKSYLGAPETFFL
jgi:hypothetical protein